MNTKMRLCITKGEEIRYLSHLDYMRAMERALRRSKLPIAYSEGFNPHMKIAYASALGVGIAACTEYMDLEFKKDITFPQVKERLEGKLPQGIELLTGKVLLGKQAALMAVANYAEYEAVGKPSEDDYKIWSENSLQIFNQCKVAEYIKFSSRGNKVVNIKSFLPRPVICECEDGVLFLRFAIRQLPSGGIKAQAVIDSLVKDFHFPLNQQTLRITRTALLADGESGLKTLLDI